MSNLFPLISFFFFVFLFYFEILPQFDLLTLLFESSVLTLIFKIFKSLSKCLCFKLLVLYSFLFFIGFILF